MVNNFNVMLFEFFRRLSSTQQKSAAMLLWSLWKSRNSKLWDALDTSSAFTVCRAKDTLQEWSCMQRAKKQVQNLPCLSSWTKPPVGMTKCNVDAPTCHNNSITDYGICFRNHLGELLIGKSDFLLSSATILEAETIALVESLKMATTNGMHEVLFETDSRTLVDVIKSNATPQNEFGDLIIQCRSFLNSNPDFVVSYIRRQANKVAHNIAIASLSHPSPHVFYHVTTTLYSTILDEIN
ncbi:uncharacterized protein [Medicago truncatula]|uniref:uncharacterized protein n=1 Tax=Medicago truncatula TaxID=3880 RepID=UPI000D2F294F|nr:uncharacterized protein LOC112418557 [Medicago truncatula]